MVPYDTQLHNTLGILGESNRSSLEWVSNPQKSYPSRRISNNCNRINSKTVTYHNPHLYIDTHDKQDSEKGIPKVSHDMQLQDTVGNPGKSGNPGNSDTLGIPSVVGNSDIVDISNFLDKSIRSNSKWVSKTQKSYSSWRISNNCNRINIDTHDQQDTEKGIPKVPHDMQLQDTVGISDKSNRSYLKRVSKPHKSQPLRGISNNCNRIKSNTVKTINQRVASKVNHTNHRYNHNINPNDNNRSIYCCIKSCSQNDSEKGVHEVNINHRYNNINPNDSNKPNYCCTKSCSQDD